MKKKLSLILGLTALLLASLATAGCSYKATTAAPNTEPPATDITTTIESSSPQPPLPSIADVVAKIKPSVVAINVEITTYDIYNQPVNERGAG